MVPLNLKLPDNFLEEEVRCGYNVSKKMKEIWAVTLDLLNEFIRVCDKYHLEYYAGFGTLLGAVRHHGYIPWDDDIDVLMRREDYMKLCEIANEFQSPYFFQTEDTDMGFSRPFARLRRSDTTGILKSEYDGSSYISYNQGIFIDIFPLDNIADDVTEKKKHIKTLMRLNRKAFQISCWSTRYVKGQSTGIIGVAKMIIAPILKRFFESFEIHTPYLKKYEAELQKFNSIETKLFGVPYFYRENEWCIWEKTDFETFQLMPFEMLQIKVPSQYVNVLEKMYGNWEEFVVGSSVHGNVIFDTSKSYQDYLKT